MRFHTVDRVTALVPGESITGVRNVAMTEDVFDTHFPNQPVLPGVLVTSTMAQLATWGSTSRYAFSRCGRLVALRQAKFRRFVRPGDQVVVSGQRRVGPSGDDTSDTPGYAVYGDGTVELWRVRATVEGALVAAIAEVAIELYDNTPGGATLDRQRFAWAGGLAWLVDENTRTTTGTDL